MGRDIDNDGSRTAPNSIEWLLDLLAGSDTCQGLLKDQEQEVRREAVHVLYKLCETSNEEQEGKPNAEPALELITAKELEEKMLPKLKELQLDGAPSVKAALAKALGPVCKKL